MVAFIASLIITALFVLPMFPYAKRRPVGTPLTWGEAMLAATYAFFLMFWVYGVVPHLWLTWADNELKWRPDSLILEPQDKGGWSPVTVSYQTVRDIVAVLIYVVFLGGQMWLWSVWQKRGAKPTTEVATSDFGRPLVKKG
ncbi:MAG: hypothetical protein R2726_22820 [Acidimicrobiales bacterium]